MRGVRRSWPLWIAVGVHAATVAALAGGRLHGVSRSYMTTEVAFDVEEEPPAAEAPASDEARAPGRESAVVVASRSVPPARTGASPADRVPASTSATEGLAPPAGSDAPWSLSQQAPPDLAVGTYWRTVAAADATRASPSRDEAPVAGAERQLRADLQAHDVEMGHSVASPLVAAAHDAASPRSAPDVGSVTIEVDADALGEIVAARVVDASGDPAEWQDVASEIRRSMAHRPLHVPEGARGVRAHLRILAERTLPAGERTSIGAGAAPDEVCSRGGPLGRRCQAGMPGVGGTWGDLSNIGARRTRVVHVRLVDEVLL